MTNYNKKIDKLRSSLNDLLEKEKLPLCDERVQQLSRKLDEFIVLQQKLMIERLSLTEKAN